MVKFTFLPMDESKISADHKKQFLNIGQLIGWEYTDQSGSYSGLLIVGEKPQSDQVLPNARRPHESANPRVSRYRRWLSR